MPLLAADPGTVLPQQREAPGRPGRTHFAPQQPAPSAVWPGRREALERLVRPHSTPQQLALRAHIIVRAADGMGVRASARELGRRAKDGPVLAQALAGCGGQAVGPRAAG